MPIRLYEDGTVISFAYSPGGKPPGGCANGSKRKTFLLNGKHKRLIRSSAIRQSLCAKYKLLFATLTFPDDINQKDANQCFSNFTDNLTTNYKLNSYVAVKENTKRGRPHFHVLLDIPFTDFKRLNGAWCAAFSGFMRFSRNAFTTGARPIVDNVADVGKYITKYITKVEQCQDRIKPTTRQYFISQNVAASPATISENTLYALLYFRAHDKYKADFFTWYRIYDFNELPEKYDIKFDSPRKKKQKKPRKIPVKLPELDLQFDINTGLKVDLCYNS